jgi:hypothetical protein
VTAVPREGSIRHFPLYLYYTDALQGPWTKLAKPQVDRGARRIRRLSAAESDQARPRSRSASRDRVPDAFHPDRRIGQMNPPRGVSGRSCK